MPSPSPDNFLDRPLLQQLAGPKAFRRGEDCFAENRVGPLHAGMDRAAAKVSGGRTYRVKLWRKRGELHHDCNCAAGREDVFCEHCVAVGLAWLQALEEHQSGSHGQPPPRPSEGEAGPSREELQKHLRALDKDRLISLVLEATDYDDILRRRLMLEAIGVSRGGSPRRNAPAPALNTALDLEAYRQILREAIECPEYVDYDAMPDYAQGIEEAIYPLGELLNSGHAAAVIDLAEFALVELDKANEMVDGGDGLLNPVYDDLQHYHLEACRAARPDPEKLAARLLDYELEGGLAVFNNAAKAYADVLGERGLAAWRRRLVREWTALPPLVPAKTGGAGTPAPIDHRRFQMQALMERMVDAEGDLAALAAVKQRDLSSAHDFLSLAVLYQTAGRPDVAMQWAERGLRAFPELPDRVGLRDFVAAAYHGLNRHENATGLIWEEFARFSDLEHYRKLQTHAERGGAEGWPRWREKARTHLRDRCRAISGRDGSALVEILLADREDEAAWTEASASGCRPELWLRLAEKRETAHPTDALNVYQVQLTPTIARGGQYDYQEAVDLVVRIHALFKRLGRAVEFEPFRAQVRAAHRGKRNFLKLLDASGH